MKSLLMNLLLMALWITSTSDFSYGNILMGFVFGYLVLWWIDADHRPTIAEGDERLRMLEANGPTEDAFTFGHAFPPPGA